MKPLSERGEIFQIIDLSNTAAERHNLRLQKINITSEVAQIEAENERLQEKAYYEDDEGKGYCYKDMCDQFKAENERLHRKIDRAYWEGHTSGRIWGRKGISRKEIQRAESWIDALKGDDDDREKI